MPRRPNENNNASREIEEVFSQLTSNESQSDDKFEIINQLDRWKTEVCVDENLITQLDGHVSGSSEDEAIIKKKMFSVNCEIKEITQVITFFRSFNFVWKSLACHELCTTGNCFF